MSKVAFWCTIGDAYAFIFSHPLRLLRIAGIWLLAMPLFEFAARLLLALSVWAVLRSSVGWIAVLGYVALVLAAIIYVAAGLSAFAVALHRAVLVGEIRSWLALPRVRRREGRFIGYSILTGILMGLPVWLLMFFAVQILAASKPGVMALITWTMVFNNVAFIAVWTYGSSMMLVFPAIAADEEGEILGRAWRRARGNRTRLFLGSILCALPFVAFGWVVSPLHVLFVASAKPVAAGLSLLPALLLNAIDLATSFLEFAVLIAFYSYCYRQLASAAPAPDAAAPQPAPAE